MPGRNLSKVESKLSRFWRQTPAGFDFPLLRSIEVSLVDPEDLSSQGLRGIREFRIAFKYPVTAICGGNGVGKSTVLSLAALAHSSVPAWSPHLAKGQSYTFQDFFARRKNEKPLDGVRVTWRYTVRGEDIAASCQKHPTRWTGYRDRPKRAVAYSPLTRILCPQEGWYRSSFERDDAHVRDRRITLNEMSLESLSSILGRSYSSACLIRRDRFSMAECSTGAASYSGFNMGGGEGSVIELLTHIQEMPKGGLMLIEEIDAALHPEAQERLVRTLLDVAEKKRVQLIFTTHSHVVIDALPRDGRILIQRVGEGRESYNSPSARFAGAAMLGRVQPEAIVYCEDAFARVLIEESLSGAQRKRVRVLDVGSSVTVIRQGVSHRRAYPEIESLCVLDGDCTDGAVEGWVRSEIESNLDGDQERLRPKIAVLPGEGKPPEMWAIGELDLCGYDDDDYLGRLSRSFDLERGGVKEILEAAQVAPDHHSLGYEFAQRTGVESDLCVRKICRSLSNHPMLDVVRSSVEELLR